MPAGKLPGNSRSSTRLTARPRRTTHDLVSFTAVPDLVVSRTMSPLVRVLIAGKRSDARME